MDIKKRLGKLRKSGLVLIAQELKLKGRSGLSKSQLLSLITSTFTDEEIKPVLDRFFPMETKETQPAPVAEKKLRWKHLKQHAHIYGIATIVGVLLCVVFFVYQESTRKSDIEKQENINKHVNKLLERQELRSQGLPIEYVDGLGDSPLFQHNLKKGQSLSKKSRFPEAIKEYNECLIHPMATASNKVAAHVLIGNCYYSLSVLKKAEFHYNEAHRLSKEVSDNDERLRGKSAALGNIGLIYRALGEPDKALKHLIEALEIFRKIGYEQGIATQLGNIGIIYSALGEQDKALKHLNESLEIDRKIGYEQGIASDLGNIGNIYSDLGDPDKALKHHREALEIFRKIGYEQGIASQLGNIGLIYSALGEQDKALQHLNEALAIFKRIGAAHLVKKVSGIISAITKK